MKLTAQQLVEYETFGFLVLRSVLGGDQLAAINAEYDRGLAAAQAHDPDVGTSRMLQWSNLSPEYPAIAGLIEDPRVCGVAEQLLGENVAPMFSNSNRWVTDTAWHPDLPVTKLQGLKIACYLQPVDGSNGALRVIPGSHREALNEAVERFLGRFDAAISDIPAHVCESEPGDIIAFDNRLYHAASGTVAGKRQLTMGFVETARTLEAENESHQTAALLLAQYQKTNAITPYFHSDWVANSNRNPRRQRSIDWLRERGAIVPE